MILYMKTLATTLCVIPIQPCANIAFFADAFKRKTFEKMTKKKNKSKITPKAAQKIKDRMEPSRIPS